MAAQLTEDDGFAGDLLGSHHFLADEFDDYDVGAVPSAEVLESHSVFGVEVPRFDGPAMAVQLTEEEADAIQEAFYLMDVDGDGTITMEELGNHERVAGHNPALAEWLDIIHEADADLDGMIEFPEFLLSWVMTQDIE